MDAFPNEETYPLACYRQLGCSKLEKQFQGIEKKEKPEQDKSQEKKETQKQDVDEEGEAKKGKKISKRKGIGV